SVREAGVDARRRKLFARCKLEIRGGETQAPSASLALDDDALDLERQLHTSPARESASLGACASASAGRRRSASAGSTSAAFATVDASPTENGPISVRRSVRQCPPSASAIARTYVPDDTRRSSVTSVPR